MPARISSRSLGSVRGRVRRDVCRVLVVASLLVGLCAPSARAQRAASEAAEDASGGRLPAVGAINGRVSLEYGYSRVDDFEADAEGFAVGTLSVEAADRHRASLALAATAPIADWAGVRGRFRTDYGVTQRGRDLFVPDNESFDSARFGVGADVFLRDPELGALTIGGDYSRIEFDDRFDADLFGASVRAEFFFPDLEGGAADWFAAFRYDRREESGEGTRPDLDFDFFAAEGGARWYPTPNFAFTVGGRWLSSDGDDVEVEEATGFLDLRWLVDVGHPVEIHGGGSIGSSERDETGFSAEDRLVYDLRAGITIRFFTPRGASLVALRRGFD